MQQECLDVAIVQKFVRPEMVASLIADSEVEHWVSGHRAVDYSLFPFAVTFLEWQQTWPGICGTIVEGASWLIGITSTCTI